MVFADRPDLHPGPDHPRGREFTGRLGPTGDRSAVGEPDPGGAAEVIECPLHEPLVTIAVPPVPPW